MMESMIELVEAIAADKTRKLRKKHMDLRSNTRKGFQEFLSSPLHQTYKDKVVDLSNLMTDKEMQVWFGLVVHYWTAMLKAEILKLMLADHDTKTIVGYKNTDAFTWTEYGYHKVNMGIPQNFLKALADESIVVADSRDPQKIDSTHSQVHYFETQGTTWAKSLPATYQNHISQILLKPLERIGISAKNVKLSLLENNSAIKAGNWQPAKPHTDFPKEFLKTKYLTGDWKDFYRHAPFFCLFPVDRPMALDVVGRWDANPTDDAIFTRKDLNDDVQIPPIFPGEIVVLRPNCVHRTGFPILTATEKRVPERRRLQFLIGSSYAVDKATGTTTQQVVFHPKWPRANTKSGFSMAKNLEINKQKWVWDSTADECAIKNQKTKIGMAPASRLPFTRAHKNKNKKMKASSL